MTEEQIKVIGAGFGRTGTLSLKKCLEILGYKCHHMEEIINNHQYSIFYDLLSSSKEERLENKMWTNLLCKPYAYNAVVDFPTSIFYEEIFHENPSAKIILTIRDDAETWYKSANNTIFKAYQLLNNCSFVKLFVLYFICKNKYERVGSELILNNIWIHFFNGEFENKKKSIKKYNDWINNVQQKIPSSQLLIYNIKEGWEPLCNFLGSKIPPSKFPYTNKQNNFKIKYIYSLKILRLLIIIILLLLIYSYLNQISA